MKTVWSMRTIDEDYINGLCRRITLKQMLAWWATNHRPPYTSKVQAWRGKWYVASAIEDLCARTGMERP